MLYVYSGCCGNTSHERRCRYSEYEADPKYHCPKCGTELKQWVTAAHIGGGTKPFEAFKSPVDGSIIASRRDLADHNRRNNVVNIHEGYSEKKMKDVINTDIYKDINKDQTADVQKTVAESIEKLNNGYKPTPAPEGDI